MQKATPLVLVMILALTAAFLALRPREVVEVKPEAPPAVTADTQGTPSTAEENKESSKELELATAAVEARPWAHEKSDIPPDGVAQFGELKNGMRYIIYPNSEPPHRVSLRLHIAAGSLMEAEDQRGLAHFLEHMVFNGTRHYSAEEMVRHMQRLGIAFGAHANAYTSFDETVYMLDLPDVSNETLELAFNVMRDFGDGALLEAAEIDKERGVILAEKISRDSVSYRLMEQQFSTLLPESLISRRFPIGDENVIRTAPRDRFVDFYKSFYSPERMTFVVVGDVDTDDYRKRIEEAFGSMKPAATSAKAPDTGRIRQPEGLETAVFHDAELSATEVSLMVVRPHEEKPDTQATRAQKMPLAIAHSILGRRFERISKQKDSPVAAGYADKSVLFNLIDMGSVGVTVADDRWKDAVPVVETEFRRAMEHGFTESELAEAKSNLLNEYEQRVRQKPTRRSEGIATGLVRTLNDQVVASAPETDLEIARKVLEGIDAEACHKAFQEFWESSGYHLILTTKEKPVDARKELAALFEDSRGTPVEPPAAQKSQEFGYTEFGKPGSVTKQNEVADLGITQLVLSNKVRVNLKRTGFETGRIRLLARIGSGQLSQPENMPMLDDFATAVFEGGGLGKHSVDDLQQILAGRNVGTSLVIGEDAFVMSGMTTPADFALQCQLMCASITDPGYREEALWQFQRAVPMLYQELKHTIAGPQRELDAWLHGGDSRFAVAPMTKLAGYTLADAKKWLTPELTKGYLELSIVGDFKPETILPDLLATFGALPARAAKPPAMDKARKIHFPDAPENKEFTYDSKIAQGVAIALWKTAGMRNNQREFRRLNLLGTILSDRLREEIREKLGASYSPNAGATGSDALEDMGYIISESVGKPEDLEKLLTTMRDLAGDLAKQGATEDEFQRALKPILGQLEKSLRDNGYWLDTVLSQSQAEPERLELARNRDKDYQSIRLEEINTLATKYLGGKNTLLVTIRPAK